MHLELAVPALFHAHDKPLVLVVDAGKAYRPLAQALCEGGLPVFPSCDQAIRSLGRYLCHRADQQAAAPPIERPAPEPVPA